MKCEYCNEEHNGSYASGRFCSTKCASRYSNSKCSGTKIVKCIVCNTEIEVDKRASDSLCKCDNCRKRKKPEKKKKEKNCLNCGKEFENKQRQYCNKKCQHEYKHKEYIRKWKNGEVDGSKSNGLSVSSHVRRYLFEKYDNKCCECGWNRKNPYINKVILEVEHIDGDSTNNKEENLKLLCPNCHSLTPTYKALNYGNGNRKRLKYYGLI